MVSVILILTLIALIVTATPVFAAASIGLSSTSGTVGSVVYIYGSGFTPSSTITSVLFGPLTQVLTSSVVVNTAGNFTAQFIVPAQSRGTYTISANSSSGDTASTTYTIIPAISASASGGKVGTQITLSGTGFNNSTTLWAYFDTTAVSVINTTATGTFSGLIFEIPNATAGVHTIRGDDNVGFGPTVNFTVTPSINVSKTNVVQGEQITVTGKGFSASSILSFSIDSTPLAVTAGSNTTGTLTDTVITIPTLSSGDHILKVSDSTGYFDTKILNSSSLVTLTPASGKVGTEVNVEGIGFGAQRNIEITFNGTVLEITPTVITDTAGKFTAKITIPETPAGTYNLVVNDGTGTATKTFVTVPSISTPDSDNLPAGTQVNLTGHGFFPEYVVTIKVGSITIGTPKADANGSFETKIVIPSSASGSRQLQASDGTNQATLNITVTAGSQISPNTGYIGDDVILTGGGFTPESTIVINFDNTPLGTAKTDSTGSFTVSLKIPVGNSGDHKMSITDGAITREVTLSIQSSQPAAPSVAYPESNAKAKQPVSFQWNPVTSPNNPVKYELQISQDASFSAILIDKKDLTESYVTLTSEEKLKAVSADNPYYWRVRAVDGAGDISDWSTAAPFIVGSIMPDWLKYFLFVVGGIVLLGIGFILGRKLPQFGYH